MALYYRYPMRLAEWRPGDYWDVIQVLARPESERLDCRGELAARLGGAFEGEAILYNSGRAALLAALRNVASRRTDPRRTQVLTASLVCDSVPAMISRAGFEPVFYDLGADMAPDPQAALSLLGARTAAAVVPYIYGKVVPVGALAAACRSHGIPLIEDCAASFLAAAPGGPRGGVSGDYSVLSFQSGKPVAAGGGGALIHRLAGPPYPEPGDGWTAGQERRLAAAKSSFAWLYLFAAAGYWRQRLFGAVGAGLGKRTMEEIHAMSRIDARIVSRNMDLWTARSRERSRVLARYAANLAATPLRLPQYVEGGYLQRLFVEFPFPVSSDRSGWEEPDSPMAATLKEKGVQIMFPYAPAHWTAAFSGAVRQDLPNTERFARCTLAVPTLGVSDSDVDEICGLLLDASAARAASPEPAPVYRS